MERQLLEAHELFEIDVRCDVDPVLMDGALLEAAAGFPSTSPIQVIELQAVLFKGIGQQDKRRFFDGPFTCIGLRGLQFIGLLVLLSRRNADRAFIYRGQSIHRTECRKLSRSTTTADLSGAPSVPLAGIGWISPLHLYEI